LPAHRLDINGDIQTSASLWVNSIGEFTVGPRESSSTRGLLRIVTQNGSSFIQSGSNATENGVAPIYFSPINAPAGSNSAVMAIDISNARVGINKPNPLHALDLVGGMRISRANNYDRMVFGFSPVESPTGHNWPLISMLVGNANAYLWGDSVYQQPGLMVGFNVHTENGAMIVDNATFGGAFIEVGLQRGGGGTFGGINFIVSHSTTPSAFSNASSNPAMSINSYYGSTAGNYVGINKINPGYSLDVKGTINIETSQAGKSVQLGITGAQLLPSIAFIANNYATTAAIGFDFPTNTIIYGYGNNAAAGFMGVVTAPGFVTSSDKTLKENIVDARTNYLDDLNKLRLVNYNRIGKTKKELGFIAQEMEEVFPSVVEKNGYDDTKGYAITALIPMLVSAVQSLSKTVSSLQGQIDEIKSASNPITP
jgi:hypothetical protein